MNQPFDDQPQENAAFEQPSPFEQTAPEPTLEDTAPEPSLQMDSVGVAAPRRANFLKRVWRGEEKLWMAFWVCGFLGSILVQILIMALAFLGFAGIIAGAVLLLAFAIWNLVAVWRSAWNAGAKIWGILARILVVLAIPGYAIFIIGMFGVGAIGGVASTMPDEALGGAIAPMVAPVVPEGSIAPVPAPMGSPVPVPSPLGAPAVPLNAPIPAEPPTLATQAQPGSPAPAAAPAPSPVSAPSAPMPVAAPIAAPAPAMDACEQRMHDFAVSNNADPKAYIAANQAYLAQCRQVLAGQKPAGQ
jgi:hypothetical protein